MNGGGIILIHDYLIAPGVTKAIDEFFERKSESIIALTGFQCLIPRLDNGV